MKTDEQQVDFINDVCSFLKEVQDDDISYIGHTLINVALDYCTRNHLEAQGLLMCVLLDRQKDMDKHVRKQLKKKKT